MYVHLLYIPIKDPSSSQGFYLKKIAYLLTDYYLRLGGEAIEVALERGDFMVDTNTGRIILTTARKIVRMEPPEFMYDLFVRLVAPVIFSSDNDEYIKAVLEGVKKALIEIKGDYEGEITLINWLTGFLEEYGVKNEDGANHGSLTMIESASPFARFLLAQGLQGKFFERASHIGIFIPGLNGIRSVIVPLFHQIDDGM